MPRGTATRARILAAARALVAGSPVGLPSVGAVAAAAGVSRLSIYHHFGSKAGLVAALATEARSVERARPEGPLPAPADRLRVRIEEACARWATDPALFRHLPAAAEPAEADADRQLALSLVEADLLRPGCSVKEAEDVIGVVTSFAVFDRLHHDGRRSTSAVIEILIGLAGAILGPP
jgi:AcrR family transcriptional regulator